MQMSGSLALTWAKVCSPSPPPSSVLRLSPSSGLGCPLQVCFGLPPSKFAWATLPSTVPCAVPCAEPCPVPCPVPATGGMTSSSCAAASATSRSCMAFSSAARWPGWPPIAPPIALRLMLAAVCRAHHKSERKTNQIEKTHFWENPGNAKYCMCLLQHLLHRRLEYVLISQPQAHSFSFMLEVSVKTCRQSNNLQYRLQHPTVVKTIKW